MKDSQHTRPLWLGSLLAVLTPAVCLLLPELGNPTSYASFASLFTGAVVLLVVSLPVTLVAMLGLGLPYVLWLRARGKLNYIFVCVGSTLIGTVTFALLSWVLTWDHRSPELLQVTWGAGLGLLAGVSFSWGAGLTIRSSRTRFVT